MRVALISDLHGNALALRRGGSRVAALLVLSMALVGTACKKTARRPAGGAAAGDPVTRLVDFLAKRDWWR